RHRRRADTRRPVTGRHAGAGPQTRRSPGSDPRAPHHTPFTRCDEHDERTAASRAINVDVVTAAVTWAVDDALNIGGTVACAVNAGHRMYLRLVDELAAVAHTALYNTLDRRCAP